MEKIIGMSCVNLLKLSMIKAPGTRLQEDELLIQRERDRERDRDRERQRDRDTETQRDRDRDRETDRQTDRQTQAVRLTDTRLKLSSLTYFDP